MWDGRQSGKGMKEELTPSGCRYTRPKVKRSHCSNQEVFYQLPTNKDDGDLNKKLEEWDRFYNFDPPLGVFNRNLRIIFLEIYCNNPSFVSEDMTITLFPEFRIQRQIPYSIDRELSTDTDEKKAHNSR